MKKLFSLLLLLAIISSAYPQKHRRNLSDFLNIPGTLKGEFEGYPKGSSITLLNVINLKENPQNPEKVGVILALDIAGQQVAMPVAKVHLLELNPSDNETFWQTIFVRENMYGHYYSKGYHYSLRQELAEESTNYLDRLYGLFYEDAYIEDYVQVLFHSIIPREINNDRPEVLKVKLLKSPSPDAYMLPNGTLLISTGLLGILDSEEELAAIIASEVAHYILDHQLRNTAKAESRARRNEFWSGVFTGIVLAVGEAVEESLQENHKYYIPGMSYIATDALVAAINMKTSNRLGMTYTPKQELLADQIARDYLTFREMNPKALVSALSKIRDYYEAEKDYHTLSRYGIYAELNNRIHKLGDSEPCINRSYQKRMSGVNCFNAILHQAGEHYESSLRALDKNFRNNLATEEEYVLMIKAHMALYHTEEANLEALEWIEKAKEMDRYSNPNLCKQEILLLLRLNRQAKAADALMQYIELLSSYDSGNSDDNNWILSEKNWAHKLIQRIELF